MGGELSSIHIVVLVVSGAQQPDRAVAGLELATAMQQSGAAGTVELLFYAGGCDHLDDAQAGAAPRERLQQAIDLGLPAFACTRSLSERDLVDAATAQGIKPVGAPVFVPARIAAGASVIVF